MALPQMQLIHIYAGWLTAYSISIILCIAIFIRTFIKFHDNPSETNNVIATSIKLTASTYYCLFLLAYILFIVELSLEIIANSQEGTLDDIEDICAAVGICLFGLAELFFFLLLILRLRITFKDSVYETGTCMYYAVMSGITMYVLVAFVYLFALIIDSSMMKAGSFVLCGCINIVIRLSLTVTYVHKLCRFQAIESKNHGGSASILDTVSKQLLLGVTAISCNLVGYVLVGVEQATRDQDAMGQKYGTFTFLSLAACHVAFWIELICIYLGFAFNHSLYWRCCGFCHSQCCMRLSQQTVEKMTLDLVRQNSTTPGPPGEMHTVAV